ncbi:MAG: hypothetical protein WCF95_07575, partial [bacterium]
MGVYILSMILCCLAGWLVSYGAVLIGWPLDFVFVSLARQFINSTDGVAREAHFSWDGTVFWKWFRMVAISKGISFLRFLVVFVILFLLLQILLAFAFLPALFLARNTSMVQHVMHV